jgi:amidase
VNGSSELAGLDALAQAELVGTGQATSIELVEAAIARIEQLDPELNAVVVRMFEQALETAAGPLPGGPLSGVPFLLKDLGAAYGGVRQTNGSRAYADHIPADDDDLVRRFRRAGLVVVGRTNTPELGNSSTTEPVLFGPTRNPWDLSRTPGGSSGGSAAAVAAGLVPAAHASDGGGSIRTPASCCGVFGLKPSRGRVPSGEVDTLLGWSVSHAVTRTVRDSAALLDAVSEFDPTALWSIARDGSFLDALAAPVEPLRVAVSVTPPNGVAVDPACREAAQATGHLLESLGHEVEEAAPAVNWETFFGVYVVLVAGSYASLAAQLEARRPGSYDLLESANQLAVTRGDNLSAGDFASAIEDMQRVNRVIIDFFERYDAWLTPTLARPPIELGAFDEPGKQSLDAFLGFDSDWNPWLPLANCSGSTSATLPLHWTPDGLPVGVQMTMAPNSEARLLRLSAQLEEAHPWRDRWPPVSIPARAS